MKNTTIVSCIAIIVLTSFCWGYYYIPEWKTQRFVEAEVLRVKSADMEGDFIGIDGWGNPVKYGRHVDKKAVLYEVISAGRDEQFETQDDIIAHAFDLNKSRIIGDWIGKKAKQTFKGVKEGWNAPSKFDEEVK